jgi:hypothetical protein
VPAKREADWLPEKVSAGVVDASSTDASVTGMGPSLRISTVTVPESPTATVLSTDSTTKVCSSCGVIASVRVWEVRARPSLSSYSAVASNA